MFFLLPSAPSEISIMGSGLSKKIYPVATDCNCRTVFSVWSFQCFIEIRPGKNRITLNGSLLVPP